MNAWTVILAAGLCSYLFRLSMIVLFDRITMPARLQRASELVAPAAFAAMAASGIATACMSRAPPGARRCRGAAAVIAVLRTGSSPGRDPRRHAGLVGRDRPATELNYRRTI